MFLLVLKSTLEGLTKRVPPEEIFTFTKFLLLTAVILPVLPRAQFTQFQINPFKTWLVVVAVSTVSYGSYLLLKVTHSRNGVLLSALLGGAYSSTVTTIALARRSGTSVPVIKRGANPPARQATMMRWGLIPSWSLDTNVGARTINARAETAATKPSFRDPLRKQRCLVPADAFYEWRRAAKENQPFCFEVGDRCGLRVCGSVGSLAGARRAVGGNLHNSDDNAE